MTRPTEILLLRHAHSTANARGVLAGRDRTVGLSPRGKREAEQICAELMRYRIDRVVVSPLPRTRETIAPYLAQKKIEFLKDSGIIEMDYGTWSGQKLSVLSKKPLWNTIQTSPSVVRFPEGESFGEMLARSTETIRRLALPKKTTLFVSHGDVIKAIVANALGMHLDNFQKIAIDPGSISRIILNDGKPFLSFSNSTHFLQGLEKDANGKSAKHFQNSTSAVLGGGAGMEKRTHPGRRK